MNIRQLSNVGATVILLAALAAELAQAHPWSCTDASPHRLRHNVAQALELDTLTLRFHRDESVLLETGSNADSRIRWPD
ncbi:hypothetical protein [Paraburkholderia sediminicola]|uniref:hypothetical protein n=1 Tax=Paraburkholderia sediminicola TaxID=458836 RepID=UPI0038B92DBC